MKKYIFLAISIICFSCKAQIYPMNQDYLNYLDNNNYIKDTNNDLNKFEGIWKWTSPTNTNTYFEVHFFKVLNWKYPSPKFNYYMDHIFGNYKYVENGVEVTNTLNRTNYNSTIFGQSPIILSNCFAPLFKDLNIIMRDVAKNNKNCEAELSIINLNSTTLTATWKMIERGDQIRIRYNGDNVTTPLAPVGFSIPTNIVLTKQ